MKRIIIPGLMLAAAFAFTNCTEQLVSPVQKEDVVVDETLVMTYEAGTPFEVEVEDLETKTATTPDGRTYWLDGDLISLYSSDHSQKADAKTYSHHNKFAYKKEKRNFYGVLSTELARYNDWYAIYPYNSGSAGTLTAEKVTIGGAVGDDYKQYQQGNEDMSHIYGDNYPLYGIKNNVYKSSTPKFKMSPLFSLIALEISNEGDGIPNNGEASITINNVEFSAAEEIVGQFTVDILQAEPKFDKVTGMSSKTARLECSNVTIPFGNTATVYLAVKPHDASNGKITISINGSSKSLTLPENFKFEAGKITTLRVPLKLSYPKVSDALGVQPAGYEFITWENDRVVKDFNVNGEKLEAHIVGEGNVEGKIIITGTARDLINGLDVGFYASTWQGKKAAMTVNRINLYMPEYNSDGSFKKHTQVAAYGPLQDAVEDIAIDILGVLGLVVWKTIGKPVFEGMLKNGIPRDKVVDEGALLTLTQFMDAANITFSGVIENGAQEGSTELVVVDENPIYKEVGQAAVEKLLTEKFDYKDDSGNIILPTYKGMYDIVNGISSPEADVTANAIYGKLKSTIGNKSVQLMSSVSVNVWDIFSSLFPDVATMKRILGDVKVSVQIATYPHGASTDLNPMIFWGLDAYGPTSSVPAN